MQSWEMAPEWVREAVDRCLHDMQQPTAIDVSLDWVVDALFPDPERSGDGFSFSHAQPGAEFVIACADLLQYQAFPESEGAWGEARPACRGHRHPAKPTVLGGEAW